MFLIYFIGVVIALILILFFLKRGSFEKIINKGGEDLLNDEIWSDNLKNQDVNLDK